MPRGRRFSGPLLPGFRSTKVYETKKQRAYRLRRNKAYKPKRRGVRTARYAPAANWQRQMTKYENQHMEKKFIPFTNWTNGPESAGYGGILPAVTIPNAGPTGNDVGLSAVVLQTGGMLTSANLSMNNTLGSNLCTPLGGYALTRGTGAISDIIGNYIQIKSTLQRVNINVDPYQSNNQANQDLLNASLPRQFRLIMVKAKRDNSVAAGASTDQGSASGALRSNLWINEKNEERGLLDPMSVQDAFTWLINKQKFMVLKDERFTLFPNMQYTKTDAVNTASGPNGIAKSQRFKNYYLPTPKNKTKYDVEHASIQPVDFQFVVHTLILCKSQGGSGNPDSKGWNVQSNGLTTYLDY